MSWTPYIWVKKQDYEEIKEVLPGFVEGYELNLPNLDGVVLYAGDCSSSNRELDDVLYGLNIHHWILNSEGANCKYCHTWGEKIHTTEEH